MKKILGIIAAILLCALTARASPMTATSTGPPDAQAVVESSDVSIGVQVQFNHNDVAGDIGLWMRNVALGPMKGPRNTALFMGDENDGLLKGPRAVALIMMQSNDLAITSVGTKAKTAQLEATPASATEVVNPANAGKTDTALFMGDESPSVMNLAVIHSPPLNHCGLISLIAS